MFICEARCRLKLESGLVGECDDVECGIGKPCLAEWESDRANWVMEDGAEAWWFAFTGMGAVGTYEGVEVDSDGDRSDELGEPCLITLRPVRERRDPRSSYD